MIATTSLLESGLPQVDYYAPNYRVEIDGAELDPATKGDVLQLKVTMEKNNLTGFSLTLNNWDDRTLSFKYSDDDRFYIARNVHIQMGYADRLVSMVKGQIKTLAPSFPQSGSPTLDISGTDLLDRLKNSKPTDNDPLSYPEMQDWEIAQRVAIRHGLGFEATREGPTHPLVVQNKDDDYAQFLLDRARRIEFDVYVQTDPASGDDKLFFVKPTDGRDSRPIRVYEFEWGKTLISFSPKLSSDEQITSVTVRGWNPRTKEPIVATASARDLPSSIGGGVSGPAVAAQSAQRSGGKQDFIVDSSVVTSEEAQKLAVSYLTKRAWEFNTGSGQVIGLPDLRPGNNVHLKGLGKRFSGVYQLQKVEHTIGGSGYLTQFDVKRRTDGGEA